MYKVCQNHFEWQWKQSMKETYLHLRCHGDINILELAWNIISQAYESYYQQK